MMIRIFPAFGLATTLFAKGNGQTVIKGGMACFGPNGNMERRKEGRAACLDAEWTHLIGRLNFLASPGKQPEDGRVEGRHFLPTNHWPCAGSSQSSWTNKTWAERRPNREGKRGRNNPGMDGGRAMRGIWPNAWAPAGLGFCSFSGFLA